MATAGATGQHRITLPPTYGEAIVGGTTAGKGEGGDDTSTNEGLVTQRWFKWFNDITAILNGDRLPLPVAIAVGASPFTYQYLGMNFASLMVVGGAVTSISFSRDNVTYYNLGITSGMIPMSPLDYFRIVYTAAPAVYAVLR